MPDLRGSETPYPLHPFLLTPPRAGVKFYLSIMLTLFEALTGLLLLLAGASAVAIAGVSFRDTHRPAEQPVPRRDSQHFEHESDACFPHHVLGHSQAKSPAGLEI